MMIHYPIPRTIRQGAGAIWWSASRIHRSWRSLARPGSAPAILVVGSLRAGGTGKTDWVDWIARRDPGRAILVHPTGDEDRWLESRHPGRVFRGRSFRRAWDAARESGFERGVSDGGLQDPWLDGCPALLLGPSRALLSELHPFGPFRQTRPTRAIDLELREGEGWTWSLRLDPEPTSPVLLGAAVARTESVITALRDLGFDAAGVLRTRDHHPFPTRGIRSLEEAHPDANWVVTAKDAARGEPSRLRGPVSVLHRTLEVEPPLAERLDRLLFP